MNKHLNYRRIGIIAAAAVAAALLIAWACDFLRPANSPPIWIIVGKIVTKVFWVIPVLGVLSLVLLLLGEALSRKGVAPNSTRRLRRAGLIAGCVVAIPLALMMLDYCVYAPIKFTYLIRKVQGAKTIQDEEAAFRSAARWGFVWELNRITEREYLSSRVRHLEGDWILELEWLESWPFGTPYRAYRKVIDEKNLRFLERQPPVKAAPSPTTMWPHRPGITQAVVIVDLVGTCLPRGGE